MKSKGYPVRILRLLFGQLLYAFSAYLILRANVGLSPWEAFYVGVTYHIPVSFGTVLNVTTALLLLIAVLMKEPIGLGTLFSIFVVGLFVDMFSALDFIPLIQNYAVGIIVMIASQFIFAFGAYFYMSSELGCGPRDALMTSIAKKCPKLKVGVARGLMDLSALVIGFLLGAKIGIGTVISIFGLTFAIQAVFKLCRFDAPSITHENIIQTAKNIFRKNK